MVCSYGEVNKESAIQQMYSAVHTVRRKYIHDEIISTTRRLGDQSTGTDGGGYTGSRGHTQAVRLRDDQRYWCLFMFGRRRLRLRCTAGGL